MKLTEIIDSSPQAWYNSHTSSGKQSPAQERRENKMDITELNQLIIAHNNWLNGNKCGKQLNLCSVDLYGVDLSGVNLSKAILVDVIFFDANLIGVNLSGADLSTCNFTKANLIDVDFTEADLSHATLRGAYLAGACFDFANSYDCVGDGKYIKTLRLSDADPMVYTAEVLQIGSEIHDIAEWPTLAVRTREWREWGELATKIIEFSPATPTGARTT
jgi:uncharacterized protein YjbI with pentapeptide repeats